jgi:hypothetical protein
MINRNSRAEDYTDVWADVNYAKNRLKMLSNTSLINEIYNYVDLDGYTEMDEIVDRWNFVDDNLDKKDREVLERVFLLVYCRGIRL